MILVVTLGDGSGEVKDLTSVAKEPHSCGQKRGEVE